MTRSRDNKIAETTAQPEELLTRIIKSSSAVGATILECFMGSGTTQAVAMKLGRRFIGADINFGAIQTTTKRLIGIADGLRQKTIDSGARPIELLGSVSGQRKLLAVLTRIEAGDYM